MEIDFEQALEESKGNGLLYKRKYDGKKVRVSGKIVAIDTEIFENKPFVCLVNRDSKVADVSKALYCYFEDSEADSVMELRTGQWVTIEGICTENLLFTFVLLNSRVVNASQPTSQTSAPSARTENTATETSTVSTQTQPSVSTENTASQTVETPVYEEHNYKLTDAEYTLMMKNADFAKADKALNNAWQNAKKSLLDYDFKALKYEQNQWISSGRDEWANILANEEGEYGYTKTEAYTVATQARANYVLLWARGYRAANVTGDKVNVRSKPNTKGKVLFQVSRYLYEYDKYDYGRERLIVDSHPVTDNKGDKWYRVYYRYNYTPDSDAPTLYEKADGYINGRFVSLEEYLTDRDYDLIVPSTAFGIF